MSPLRIDKGSLVSALHLGTRIKTMRVEMIYGTYYERSYFSLFNCMFDILIGRES